MDGSADSWLATGFAHYEAGNWSDAADAIERALAAAPDRAEAWYRLGNVRQEQDRQLPAVECYERATTLDPAHARAWNNLGVSRQALGQAQSAADAYRAAVRCDPALAVAHRNLGHLLSEAADHSAAARCFEDAAAADGGNADPWCEAGRSWQRARDNERAAEAFRNALAADPAYPRAYLGLAGIAASRGDSRGAEAWYRVGIQHCPDDAILRHMLAAICGERSERPPAGYVAITFDAMAHGFDRHLVQELDYRVPEKLAQIVLPMLEAPACRVLDLGCGTGLVGAALARSGIELTGVDLSGEMLREAERRGIYARLVQGDLLDELERRPAASLHAVLAADTFIYLGDLSAVFASAARALAPGGLFAFSVEDCEGQEYLLRPSGRYAHSTAYVRALAARSGLVERQLVATPLRKEGTAYVQGWLVCLARPPASGGSTP